MLCLILSSVLFLVTCSLACTGSFLVGSRLYFGVESKSQVFGEDIAKWMPAVGLALIYVGLSSGMAQVCYTLPAELLPSRARGLGLGLLNFFQGISVFVTINIKHLILVKFGMEWVFFGMAVSTFVSALLVIKFIPETKGKTLVQIEQYYRRKFGWQNQEDRNRII